MLRLTSFGESVQPTPRAAGRPSQTQCVSFGGVVFELLSAEPLPIDPAAARFFRVGADPRTVADVACAVRVDAGREWPSRIPNEVVFSYDAAGATRVHARTFEAELSRLGPGRYAAAATVAPGCEAVSDLLRGLAASMLHAEGGVVMHAAGLVLDGVALLLVGPSGAGKSTALRSTRGATCLADDHVALVPRPEGWFAWGLPGGTAAGIAPSDSSAYPLGAIVRVRRGAPGSSPGFQLLRGASALFALRESVEWADRSAGAEELYLRAVTDLSSQVRVAAIETVLGRDNLAVLRALMASNDKRALT